jgi:SNF2 family DNA or RNA helicase
MGNMKLYSYQTTGKDFLKKKSVALLADDMGLGKSIQAIAAAEELKLTQVLIVCPASVKYNWRKEILK